MIWQLKVAVAVPETTIEPQRHHRNRREPAYSGVSRTEYSTFIRQSMYVGTVLVLSPQRKSRRSVAVPAVTQQHSRWCLVLHAITSPREEERARQGLWPAVNALD